MNATPKFIKLAGRGSSALEFGIAAWDQWESDSDDPDLNKYEKAIRAGIVGSTTALGAAGGGLRGGILGGAIVPGPGALFGAAIVGIGGGEVGKNFSEFLIDNELANILWGTWE